MFFFFFLPFFIYASTNDIEKIEIVITDPQELLVEPSNLFIEQEKIEAIEENNFNLKDIFKIETFFVFIDKD